MPCLRGRYAVLARPLCRACAAVMPCLRGRYPCLRGRYAVLARPLSRALLGTFPLGFGKRLDEVFLLRGRVNFFDFDP